MKRLGVILYAELLVLMFLLLVSAGTKASELAQPVMLVATDRVANPALAETVVVAAPLSDGSHIGFIVNHPTGEALTALFPEQVAAREVVDSVFAGGPILPQVMFAIAHSPPVPKEGLFELMPGVVVAFQADVIDHIIETAPNDARYYLGFVLWLPGDLEKEIGKGVWQVRPAESRTLFAQTPKNLWKSLYHGGPAIEAYADPVPPMSVALASNAASHR